MSFSYASVIETHRLNSRFIRITLKIDDPAALNAPAAGDSAVGVYFSGTEARHDPDAEGRNYSVRHQHGDVIDIDVLLHERGLGSDWAQQTRPGDRIGLDHARCWYRPEPTTQWQLLLTDLSGLPATARIIEQLGPTVPITVVAEVADHSDLDYLPAHPQVTVVHRIGTGNGNAPEPTCRGGARTDTAQWPRILLVRR